MLFRSKPLDGVRVSLSPQGTLQIEAPQVHEGLLVTNDLAELLPDGSFRILGRRDNVIDSGGLKMQAEAIEAKLSDLPVPFLITAAPDERLGEAVALVYEARHDLTGELAALCRERLDRYEQPRRWLRVDCLPRTETGKPARKLASALFGKA